MAKRNLFTFPAAEQTRILCTPVVVSGPITIVENQRLPYTRWLGVIFDRKLSFKWHVRTLTGKALKVSHVFSSLGNTVGGVPPHLVRTAALACVLPIAYYASETWWPGRSRQCARSRISNCIETILQRLDKVVFACARAILPVYRTTPTAVLLREFGLLASKFALDRRAASANSTLHNHYFAEPIALFLSRVERPGLLDEF
ncbi:hypothetical protein K3495_g6881 [Podosphaera aphanis]|nr:hypothetical protein K3495_g6881 [Podosphaera aphanis]